MGPLPIICGLYGIPGGDEIRQPLGAASMTSELTLQHWVTHENTAVTWVLSEHTWLSHMLHLRLETVMDISPRPLKTGQFTHLMRSTISVETSRRSHSRTAGGSTSTGTSDRRRWLEWNTTRLIRNRRETFILQRHSASRGRRHAIGRCLSLFLLLRRGSHGR